MQKIDKRVDEDQCMARYKLIKNPPVSIQPSNKSSKNPDSLLTKRKSGNISDEWVDDLDDFNFWFKKWEQRKNIMDYTRDEQSKMMELYN